MGVVTLKSCERRVELLVVIVAIVDVAVATVEEDKGDIEERLVEAEGEVVERVVEDG